MVTAAQKQVPQEKELVSFVDLKAIFSRLPETSLVRRLVLAEPDYLPRALAEEKAFLYLEMLEKEQQNRR
jgi:hypothetical protein